MPWRLRSTLRLPAWSVFDKHSACKYRREKPNAYILDWPRGPRQRVDLQRPFSVSLLPAVPAADVHRLAAGVWRFFCRTRSRDGADVRDDRGGAGADRLSRRPLWRAALPDRRHDPDDLVDRRDGACHRLLADRLVSDAVGARQFGH